MRYYLDILVIDKLVETNIFGEEILELKVECSQIETTGIIPCL